MLIKGTVFNDFLRGSADDDVIHGDLGTDVIYGLGGNDLIWGGDNASVAEYLDGGEGDDTIYGGKGVDQFFDLDTTGNDVLDGGSGGDSFVVSSGGADSYTGGSGFDFLVYDTYSDPRADLTLDLSKGTLTGGGNTDSIQGFEAVGLLGSGNHTVKGSKDAEMIYTGSGNDTIRGYKGADVVDGGGGNDTFQWERVDLDAVDIITGFSLASDTLDFRGLIKATKFSAASDVVRLEDTVIHDDLMGMNYAGTRVSVYAGKDLGWQDVVVLAGHSGVSLDSLADCMLLA